MIKVKKLVKRFGLKTVLRGLDFNAEAGEFVAIMGPNGAGKTTFLRILASLSKPTLGEVQLAGYRLPSQAASVRGRLGVVTHMPLLYGDLTADENLRFFGRLFNVNQDLKQHIDVVLEKVGLASQKNNLVRTFSRGMQQRLAIARAIIHDPEILLFDEPHTGLDQDASNRLDHLLMEVAREGRTVVMTSHDLARVERLSTRFDILSGGIISSSTSKTALGSKNLLDVYRQAILDG